jgi:hypothetical protein
MATVKWLVLAPQVGHQAGDVVPGVGALLGGAQGGDERLHEPFQPGQQAPPHRRVNHRVIEQLVQRGRETVVP